MTKKHFNDLAQAFANTRPLPGSFVHDQWLDDVLVVAAICAKHNSAFNREKFLEACKTRQAEKAAS